MTSSKPHLALYSLALLLLTVPQAIGQKKFNSPPTLHKQGTATQLIVEDKPFLVLGGETGNSSGSGYTVHEVGVEGRESHESQHGTGTHILGAAGT